MDGLGSDKMHDIDWYEANYQALLRSDADDSKRMEALEALLEEQYVERYMTEYAAVCLRNGREREAQRILKKQLFLFPGGPFEELAERLTEEGESAAEQVLEALKNEPSSDTRPQPDGVATPVIADTSASTGETGGAEEPSSCDPALPEAVARCFERVVGMEGAKKVMLDLYTAMQYQAARAGYDLKTQRHHHFLIRGDIGGGKTLLAERVCNFLHEMGVASEAAPCVLEDYRLGDVLGTDGSGLEEALDACEGRNVVVDGISTLFESADHRGGNRPLLFRTVLERYSDKVNFLLCGTKKDIDHLLTLEPSLSGWFLYDIELPAYSPEELLEMAVIIAKDRGYTLSTGAKTALLEQLENEYRSPTFQSGKTLEGIIGRASLHLAGRVASLGPASKGKLMRIEPEDLNKTAALDLDAYLSKLNALTGLTEVKKEIEALADHIKVNAEAKKLGLPPTDFGTLHMVFTGNPGTGKTTVARIVGGIYRALGILPEGDKVIECGRSDLVAEFVGQTAPKVKGKIKESLGGVLFIDEAYDLCRDDSDSYGLEAVNTLVAEIENHRNDFMVIVAGYSQDMDRFMDRNKGLSSRFPHKIEFPDYTQEEMEEILTGMLSADGKVLEEGAHESLRALIKEQKGKRDFGNARGLRNLRERLISAQNSRLAKEMNQGNSLTKESFSLICVSDFADLLQAQGREKTVEQYLAELDELTGLSAVKKEVHKRVNTMLGQQKMKEEGALTDYSAGTLHMVFKGNAGTGKTTVARIIAGIYGTLGLLPDGERFIECSRADLVAEYVGQTASKVKSVVSRAMGGVLFIDEAYSLCRDSNDTFGREAVDTLIADMENHRHELMVILAGYDEDMDQFLSMNQGMKSRVPTTLDFEDYTPDELMKIFTAIIQKSGLSLSQQAEEKCRRILETESKKSGFGNARGARNLAEKIMSQHVATVGEKIGAGEELDKDSLVLIQEDEVELK